MSNSQEQLSDSDIETLVVFLNKNKLNSPFAVSTQKLLTEYKRLQAIEAERDELRKVVDRQHIQLDKYESLLNEGVNDHE